MPNHVSHYCEISGPKEDLNRFISEIISVDGDEGLFNFENIISMPAELNIESTHYPNMDDILYALGGLKKTYSGFEINQNSPLFEKHWYNRILTVKGADFNPCEYSLDEHKQFIIAWYEEFEPKTLEYAKLLISNYQKYGFDTWYDWRLHNWGTKWGSYQVEWDNVDDNNIYLKFQTAWSPPEPILNKLVEMFPTLTFHMSCFDEGHCFAGDGIWGTNFEFYSDEDLKQNPEKMQEIYTKVYGYSYEEYIDEDEENEDS